MGFWDRFFTDGSRQWGQSFAWEKRHKNESDSILHLISRRLKPHFQEGPRQESSIKQWLKKYIKIKVKQKCILNFTIKYSGNVQRTFLNQQNWSFSSMFSSARGGHPLEHYADDTWVSLISPQNILKKPKKHITMTVIAWIYCRRKELNKLMVPCMFYLFLFFNQTADLLRQIFRVYTKPQMPQAKI